MKIDESHDLIVEPGPYPPGEGPLDYAECSYHCRSLDAPCVVEWPPDGWVEVDEPDRRRWETTPREINDIDTCTECDTPLGFTESEYEGQYGLRLVEVWVTPWTHPDLPNVVACEDCTMIDLNGDDR